MDVKKTGPAVLDERQQFQMSRPSQIQVLHNALHAEKMQNGVA